MMSPRVTSSTACEVCNKIFKLTRRKFTCNEPCCFRSVCMACSHKVPGRRGRVCRICVSDIGVRMCDSVQGMCSSGQVPGWKYVEQTLRNEFGAWALDLTR